MYRFAKKYLLISITEVLSLLTSKDSGAADNFIFSQFEEIKGRELFSGIGKTYI